MIFREALTSLVAGVADGHVLSMARSRLVRSLLYNGSPNDPAVFGIAIAVAVGTAAMAIPAHRAAMTDPAQALRALQ
jgi:ABC-type antimicrobial peptide transport system permease subunit